MLSRRLIAPPVRLLPARLLKSLPGSMSEIAPLPLVTIVAPDTIAAAFCVTAPLPALVFTVRLPAVMASSASALMSVIDTAAPVAAAPTLPKLLPGFVSRTAPPLVTIVVAPGTAAAKFWVMSPATAVVVTARLVALIVSSATPFALPSVMLTVPPVTPIDANALPACVRLTVPLPAFTLVAPVTTEAAFCDTAPLPRLVLTVRVAALMASSARALMSVIETARFTAVTPTLPKLLPGLVSATIPPLVSTVVAPATVAAPICDTSPVGLVVVTARLAALVVSSATPLALASVTLTAPPLPPTLFRRFA